MAKFCWSCGAPHEGGNFCNQCGQAVLPPSTDASLNQTAAATPPQQPAPPPATPAQTFDAPLTPPPAQTYDASLTPPPVQVNPTNLWQGFLKLHPIAKGAIGLGLVVLLAFTVVYSIFGGQTPEGQLKKFHTAIEEKDVDALTSLVTSEAAIDEAGLTKFVEYMEADPDRLEAYNDEKIPIKQLVKETEKKFGLFVQYRVVLPAIELSVNTTPKALILIDGKEVLTNEKGGKILVGKYLPGQYVLQAKVTYPFGEFLSDEEEVTLRGEPGKKTSTYSYSLDLNANAAKVDTQNPLKKATVTVDDHLIASDFDLGSYGTIKPLPNKDGAKVRITSQYPFGSYSESFVTRQFSDNGSYSVQSVPSSADNKALLDAISKPVSLFIETLISGEQTMDYRPHLDVLDPDSPFYKQLRDILEEKGIPVLIADLNLSGTYQGVALDAGSLKIVNDTTIQIIARYKFLREQPVTQDYAVELKFRDNAWRVKEFGNVIGMPLNSDFVEYNKSTPPL